MMVRYCSPSVNTANYIECPNIRSIPDAVQQYLDYMQVLGLRRYEIPDSILSELNLL